MESNDVLDDLYPTDVDSKQCRHTNLAGYGYSSCY